MGAHEQFMAIRSVVKFRVKFHKKKSHQFNSFHCSTHLERKTLISLNCNYNDGGERNLTWLKFILQWFCNLYLCICDYSLPLNFQMTSTLIIFKGTCTVYIIIDCISTEVAKSQMKRNAYFKHTWHVFYCSQRQKDKTQVKQLGQLLDIS